MAETRRVLRKLEMPHDSALDEQLWPVNVALVVLGGFSVGTSLAYLRFDNPNWMLNATTYVVSIPLIIGLAMLAFRYVSNRFWRRSMQFALVLSGIVHVFLIIVSVESDVFTTLLVEPKTTTEHKDRRDPTVKAEYNPHLIIPDEQNKQPDFTKPVETKTPEPETVTEVKKTEEVKEVTTQKPQPIPVPEPQVTMQPSVVKQVKPEDSTPREAVTPSQLSRQTRVNQINSSTAVADKPKPAEAKTDATATPQVTSVQKQSTAAQSAVANPVQEAVSTQPSPTVAMAKKATESDVKVETSATSQLKRQVNQPAITPKSQINTADVPAIAKRTDNAELIPQNTATDKRVTASPVRQKAEAEQTPEASVKVTPVEKATLDSPTQPTIAQATIAMASKQPRMTMRPSAEMATPQSPAAKTDAADPSLPGPQSTSVTRVAAKSVADKAAKTEASAPNSPDIKQVASRSTHTQAQPSPATPEAASSRSAATTARNATAKTANVVTHAAAVEANTAATLSPTISPSTSSAIASKQNAANNPSANRTQAALDAPTVGAGTPNLSGGITRATTSNMPSLTPDKPVTGSPQRAAKASSVAASPTNVESPANAVGSAGAVASSAEPARLALSRSQAGTAGVGNSPNMDRGAAAGDSPALVSSVAARRNEASTAGPADSALTPSTPATRAQNRASAAVPSSNMQAELVAGGTQGGSSQLAEVNASASAAISKANGNAAPGEVSAAKGTTDIDTGTTMIVAEAGQSRASGGGQPELSFDPQQGSISRQKSSGSPQSSLAVEKVANVPSAPEGTGGGEPASLDPTANLAVRGSSDKGPSGGPSTAQEKGSLDEPSSATLVSQTPSSRAIASEGGVPDVSTTSDEDEEEKKKRLARAQARAALQMAASSIAVQDVPSIIVGEGTGTGSLVAGATGPANTTTTRLASNGGAPAGGNLPSVGDASPATNGTGTPGVTVARSDVGASSLAPNTSLGGGTGSPTRAAAGQTIATNTQADITQLAGQPNSGGGPKGIEVEAQGLAQSKVSGGASGTIVAGPIGAAGGPNVVEAIGSAASVGAVASGARNTSPSSEEGPNITAATTTSLPGKRGPSVGMIAAGAAAEQVAYTSATSAVAQADLDHGAGAGVVSRKRADSGSGLMIHLDAPEGTGGIGANVSREVGLNSRLAKADSLELNASPKRFIQRKSGGIPSVSLAAVVPTESFRQRAEGRKSGSKLPPQTETAIELGLLYLSRHQQEDGSWRLQGLESNTGDDPIMVSDSAATAMSLLAFQGAGYNHREHKYANMVRNGLDFLVRNQKDNGDLFVPLDDSSNKSVWLYSHALATLALCEAYGMTQDPSLKEPAQKAVDFILRGQSNERGGWRYSPGVGTDTSVTGAMLIALRSAQLADLKVPEASYQKVRTWLDAAQASPNEAHLYRYNPYAPDTDAQRHGRKPGPTMTSLGLLMRLYLGWKRDNPHMIQGAEYLKENLPSLGTNTDLKRDTYYWYYATQVMYHMGGDHWKKWNAQLHAILTESQIKEGNYAGSWNPRSPVPDRWAAHGGRLYVTTLNLLSLEVQYRHLPTYDDTAK